MTYEDIDDIKVCSIKVKCVIDNNDIPDDFWSFTDEDNNPYKSLISQDIFRSNFVGIFDDSLTRFVQVLSDNTYNDGDYKYVKFRHVITHYDSNRSFDCFIDTRGMLKDGLNRNSAKKIALDVLSVLHDDYKIIPTQYNVRFLVVDGNKGYIVKIESDDKDLEDLYNSYRRYWLSGFTTIKNGIKLWSYNK